MAWRRLRETNGWQEERGTNLKKLEGREAFLALAELPDVVMEGNRPV